MLSSNWTVWRPQANARAESVLRREEHDAVSFQLGLKPIPRPSLQAALVRFEAEDRRIRDAGTCCELTHADSERRPGHPNLGGYDHVSEILRLVADFR